MIFDIQHVPPGTQENYNSFSSGNSITEKAKEIIQPEGPGGGKGEPGVPPIDIFIKTPEHNKNMC